MVTIGDRGCRARQPAMLLSPQLEPISFLTRVHDNVSSRGGDAAEASSSEDFGHALFKNPQMVGQPIASAQFLQPARRFIEVLERELERAIMHWHKPFRM